MKKIFNIALLSAFIFPLSLDFVEARSKNNIQNRQIQKAKEVRYVTGLHDENLRIQSENIALKRRLNGVKSMIELYNILENDGDFKTVYNACQKEVADIEYNSKAFGNIAASICDNFYSGNGLKDGKIIIPADSGSVDGYDIKKDNENINKLLAFKYTLAIFKVMKDFNAFTLTS